MLIEETPNGGVSASKDHVLGRYRPSIFIFPSLYEPVCNQKLKYSLMYF